MRSIHCVIVLIFMSMQRSESFLLPLDASAKRPTGSTSITRNSPERFLLSSGRIRTSLCSMTQSKSLEQEQDFKHIPLREPIVPKLGQLRNQYFAIRHGESEGNILGVISSHPVQGTIIHGLTEKGRAQAQSAASDLLEAVGGLTNIANLVIYSSNFTRARQTAMVVADTIIEIYKPLQTDVKAERIPINILPALRERWFGELDNTIITNYNKVWPADLRDAACSNYGVESVDRVCERLKNMMLELEERHSGKCIALVSHADTLQILQTYLAGADCRTFSQYRFKNGEVRPLLQDKSALPEPVPLRYTRQS